MTPPRSFQRTAAATLAAACGSALAGCAVSWPPPTQTGAPPCAAVVSGRHGRLHAVIESKPVPLDALDRALALSPASRDQLARSQQLSRATRVVFDLIGPATAAGLLVGVETHQGAPELMALGLGPFLGLSTAMLLLLDASEDHYHEAIDAYDARSVESGVCPAD